MGRFYLGFNVVVASFSREAVPVGSPIEHTEVNPAFMGCNAGGTCATLAKGRASVFLSCLWKRVVLSLKRRQQLTKQHRSEFWLSRQSCEDNGKLNDYGFIAMFVIYRERGSRHMKCDAWFSM